MKQQNLFKVLMLMSFVFILNLQVQAQKTIPEIVGHRGASALAPENTLIAARVAWELGADGTELDIHLTADNEIVVIHDKTSKRTTGVNLSVAETKYEDLKKLDAGSWKDPKYAGEPIPLLKDILKALPTGKTLYIEIKSDIKIVQELVKLLQDYPKRDQLRIIAFDFDTIVEAKQSCPDIPCYYLKTIVLAHQYKSFVQQLQSNGLDGADLNHNTITKDLVAALKAKGMVCLAWTVNSPEKAQKLHEMGVVGITSDEPGLMKKFFN